MLYARPFFLKMVHTLKRKKYISLMLCFVLLPLQVVRAADSNSQLAETASDILVWRAADGLPSDSVTAILQTRDGFLWVGTSAGLVRFDGVKFTTVKLTVPPQTTPVHVTALCEDEDGRLWIGTQQDGLFELAQGSVRHFTTEQGLLDDRRDQPGGGQPRDGLDRHQIGIEPLDGAEFQVVYHADGLPDDFVSGVNVARSGTVWITTRIGMCRFIDGRIAPYAFQTESQGRSPEYLGAYEDRRGNLWAFGDTYLINLAEGKRFNYFRSSESASVRIWSLCEGRDGRLWIGTSGRGLFCFEDNRFQPVILGENRWPYDVRAICEDREGNLWLGTSGGGLVQLRPQSVHVLRAGQGLPDGSPTALALDASGRIYVGCNAAACLCGESGRFDRVGRQRRIGSCKISFRPCAWRVTARCGRALWATGCMACEMDAKFISPRRTAWRTITCWRYALTRMAVSGPALAAGPSIVLPDRALTRFDAARRLAGNAGDGR